MFGEDAKPATKDDECRNQEDEPATARANGDAVVEVSDDGRGGAEADGGSGLAGLVDRLEALDGRLTVTSPRGAGTIIRAEIPCASS